jgi:hypothetical protein
MGDVLIFALACYTTQSGDVVDFVLCTDGCKWLQQQVPQLKFGVFFAGVLAKPSMVHFLCEPLEVPSIHIIGDRDPIKSVGTKPLFSRHTY